MARRGGGRRGRRRGLAVWVMRRAIACVQGGNNEQDLTSEMHINCSLLVKHVKQRGEILKTLIFITGPLWWFALCQLQYSWAATLTSQARAPSKYIGSGSVSSVRQICIGSSAAHMGFNRGRGSEQNPTFAKEEAKNFKKRKPKKKKKKKKR